MKMNYSSKGPTLWQGKASHKHPLQMFADLLLKNLEEESFHIFIRCLLDYFPS